MPSADKTPSRPLNAAHVGHFIYTKLLITYPQLEPNESGWAKKAIFMAFLVSSLGAGHNRKSFVK